MKNLDYGVIGNCTSAALVSKTGSVDWLCLPYFDSPSVFAALLDKNRGGAFAIHSDTIIQIDQSYMRNTNILSTVVKTGTGIFEIVDFMPRYKQENGDYHCPPDVIRYLRVRSGVPVVRIAYNPQLGYGVAPSKTTVHEKFIKSTSTKDSYESMYLYSDLDLHAIAAGEHIELRANAFFLLSYNQKLSFLSEEFIDLEYQKTKAYWMGWVARTTFSVSRYRGEIIRSMLVLKLLSYQPTGALLAAVTTSLPEALGEARNWDYRYCWIRDASMAISVLSRLGHQNVSRRFMQFVLDVIPFKDEKIQIMYGIRGEKRLEERILDHLSGYEESKPVRVGNAAYVQKQNDIYGVLLDIIYYALRTFYVDPCSRERLWTVVRSLVRTVSVTWSKPDRGIWEYRSVKKHFTFSKLLCWLAMDRGAKIAELLGANSYAYQWRVIRDQIQQDILAKGWNNRLQSFTQYYGGEYLDAANLLFERYGFLSADDPRYIMTVRKTEERLCYNGLMYRYRNDDDFGKPSSSFTLCTFWMISALHRISEYDKARDMFEKVLSMGNHLCLFSEDIDVATGRLLGNFPQAYSHLGFIDTAMLLYGESSEGQSYILEKEEMENISPLV